MRFVYLVHLGTKLLEPARAAASVGEYAAGDEHHYRRRHAVAHGAHQAQHHEHNVHTVCVHEH